MLGKLMMEVKPLGKDGVIRLQGQVLRLLLNNINQKGELKHLLNNMLNQIQAIEAKQLMLAIQVETIYLVVRQIKDNKPLSKSNKLHL
jgi:hypothetical protein